MFLLLGLNRALMAVFDKATKYVVSSVKVYVFFFLESMDLLKSHELLQIQHEEPLSSRLTSWVGLKWAVLPSWCMWETWRDNLRYHIIGKILLAIRGQEGQECWMVSYMLRKSHSTKYCSVLNDSLMFYFTMKLKDTYSLEEKLWPT